MLIRLILLLLLLTSCSNQSQSLRIGVLAPLTGPLATITENARNGLELARSEINNRGGINGQPIELFYEDIEICYPKKAVDATKKFLGADQLKIIFSLVCGGNQIMATHEITEPAKVIHFSSSAVIGKISSLGKYIFRNMTKNDWEMAYLAKEVRNRLPYQKLFILTILTEWGQSYRDAIKNAWQKEGGTVVGIAEADQNERDYRTYLLQAKQSGADVIFMGLVNGQPMALGLQQAAELGLKQQVLTGYNNVTPNTIEVAKNAAEGVLFPYPSIDQTSTALSFQDKYKHTYNTESDIHAANSYDMLYLTTNAIKQCRLNTDCIAEFLYNIKNYDGVSGLTTFDQNGDVNKPFKLWTVRQGRRAPFEK